MNIDKALSQEINDFIKENNHLTYAELSDEIYQVFGIRFSEDAVRKRYRRCNMPRKKVNKQVASEEAIKDRKLQSLSQDKRHTDKKYKALIDELERVERERDAVLQLKETSSYTIKPTKSKKNGEATAVIVASDWHYEELVEPAIVSDLNEYNLTIARKRIKEFFQHAVRLIEIQRSGVDINNAILALLGDFISGSIHDELMEGNQLLPVHALMEVEEHIISGIEFILDQADVNLTVVCHSGNHGRATKQQRHATEAGNSFERYLYHCIASHFADDKRVKFIIPDGYHSYVNVYDYRIRFHHGHALRYGGGIGGLYIPTNKAIAQWNKARTVDLDVFGHFHQMRDGGNFICNGSMIGYNGYALSIKAEYEPARQTFFLVDKKRGRTVVCPILFDK